MAWTKEQAQAIKLRGKNILVSAAAGSGKTAVLIERIKRLIIEDRCSVDRMLVVTFTKAAALEMKEKAARAIREELARPEDEISREDRRFLREQLDLLDEADISTFHSFALEVIRRYFYVTGLDPQFGICDEGQSEILKQDSMDALLEELHEEASEEFRGFLDRHSGERNDKTFREIIFKTYNTIMAMPEPFEWLHEAVEALDMSRETFENSRIAELIWNDAARCVEEAAALTERTAETAEALGLEGIGMFAEEEKATLGELSELIEERNFDGMVRRLSGITLKRMAGNILKPVKNGGDEFATAEGLRLLKKSHAALKKATDTFRKNYFYAELEDIVNDVRATYSDSKFLEKAVIRYDEIFKAMKREKRLLDFNDIEHCALEILKNEEVSNSYKKKFEHIFIDEYQDSNYLQEALIERVSRGGNLFMVGDVKQSIYRFRLAEPAIFLKRYGDYSYSEGDASDGVKIDLNRNFRSKEPVVQYVNDICSRVMPGYDDNQALHVGNPETADSPYKPKAYLVNEYWSDDSDSDGSLREIIKARKEALAAAKIIKEYLGKPIFDQKANAERPLGKRDIVILMKSVRTNGEIFRRVLTENGIDAFVEDNSGFFDTIEISTFMNLLSVLDNEKQDMELISVMHSELFGFEADELAEIRIFRKDCSYYDAAKAAAEGFSEESDPERQAIFGRVREMFEKLAAWRELSRLMPLDEFVWKLMLDTGFYVRMGAMPGGAQRLANLRSLTEKAGEYRKSRDNSLYGFIRYADKLRQRMVDTGQVKMAASDADTVRIMTIHKSKGLEFPMVILAGFANGLKYSQQGTSAVSISGSAGLSLTLSNSREHWTRNTIIQNVIGEIERHEGTDEAKRVLYVALTRAADILILLGSEADTEKKIADLKEKLPSDGSYLGMAGAAIMESGHDIFIIPDDKLADTVRRRTGSTEKVLKLIDGIADIHPDERAQAEAERVMSYVYPYGDELELKSKYSVSELNSLGAEHKSAGKPRRSSLTVPECLSDEKKFSAAEIGTFTHKALEKLDFSRAAAEGEKYIGELISGLVRDEYLTDAEASCIDKNALKLFAASDIGRRITASPEVRREQPFSMITAVETENGSGKDVIVQGIIDCCFREEDGWVIVDYKTTNVRSEEEFRQRYESIKQSYKTQIDLYKRALEEATGEPVREAYLYLTNAGRIIEM